MKKYIIILIALTTTISVFAQPKKNNGGDIGTQTQTSEKDFDVTLNETERIKGELSLPALDTSVKAQSYNLSTRNFKVAYAPPKIRPIGMGSDKKNKGDDKAKNGYVKVGYGVPHSPYGEAGYAYNSKDFDASIALKHHSMNNKNVKFQQFNETGGKLNVGYHLNKDYAVGGHVGYNQRGIWAYGALDSITSKNAMDGNLRTNYKLFDVGFSVYNTSKNDMDLTYSASLDFSSLRTNFASKEFNTDLKLQATKWFADKHPLALALRSDFNKFDFLNRSSSKKESLNNLYVMPSFTFHADAFSLKAGLNLVGTNDEWKPLPDLEATVRVLGDRLAIFGGWKGDIQKNTYHTLTNYNPYLLSSIQSDFNFGKRMQNTTFQDFFGGVKGHWGAVNYNVQGGYKPSKNLAFFIQNTNFNYNSSINNGRFDVIYGDADITYLKGSIGAKINAFEIGGTVSQNIYKMKTATIQKPWHLPSTEINGTVAYRLLQEKLKLKSQVFFQNGVPYLKSTGAVGNLGTLVDLNVGGEYNINSNFGLFLNLNNLLNQKRERWYNYPSYGLNVLGGLVARF